MNTDTIPNHYPETWDRSWIQVLQTADFRLAETYMPDTLTGDRKWYNIGGTVTFKKKTARYAKTTYVDYATTKSWIFPEAWDAPILQDEWDFDYLDTIVVPSSRIMQDQAMAFNRLRDAYIRDAVQGTRITGSNGTVTEAFPAGNIIAETFGGGGSVGLTFAKIVEATRLMDSDRVPQQDRYFAINSKQKSDLMTISEAVNRDFANTLLIRSGQIHNTEWAGFIWKQYEDLEFVSGSSTDRQALAWYKRDIVLGDTGMKTHMDILPGESHALQIRPVTKLGSGKINNSSYIIECDET